MTLRHAIEPLPPDDETIRQALEDAHLRSLLPALAQITGDPSVLRDDLRPTPRGASGPAGRVAGGGRGRGDATLALRTLVAWRDAGSVVAEPPSPAAARRMIDYLLGEPVSDDYLPLLLEELAFADGDARAPRWRKEEIAAGRSLRVIVIGAGMSGVLAARRLRQAGIPCTVVEKNGDVGGTWFENTYPGARVDTPNHLYSYACAQKLDWPYHYLAAGNAAGILPRLRHRVRRPRGHPLPHRGAPGRLGRRPRPLAGGRPRPGRRRGDA